jgi:glycosyltransferase involved in cell wall biosynthesis
MTSRKEISVIVPVYNESESLEKLVDSLQSVLSEQKRSFEIIIVDDGSEDGTDEVAKKTLGKYPSSNGALISFRKNYGKSAALSAGFDRAVGRYIITIDGDLQNDPKDIPEMIKKLEEGYDLVSGWRVNRKDAVMNRILPSVIANALISSLTKAKLHDYGCALKVYRREIIDDLNLYGEHHRFIPALAAIEGAKIFELPVNHHPRIYGQSKYNILRTFEVIFDLITVVFFRKFLNKPLHIFGSIGGLAIIAGILGMAVLGFDKFILGQSIGERPLLIVSVLSLLAGIQFVAIGILAEILIRTYYESQSKPIYRIRSVFENETD